MKSLDVPPVWLAAALALAWGQARYFSGGLDFGPWGIVNLFAAFLVGGGLILMLLAVQQMRQAHTTFFPHEEASVLVTGGIFQRTRNPIYLGDVMVLAGMILYWDAVLALPLVPILLWVLERRFVIPEEDRLRRKFRTQYAAYSRKTRRWL